MNIIEIISIITSYLTKCSFIFFMTWMFVGMLCYYQMLSVYVDQNRFMKKCCLPSRVI